MDKMELIKTYLDRCEEVIVSENLTIAHKLQDEIIGVFESEISDITNKLDNYSMRGFYSDTPRQVDYIGDVKLLKQKLINYIANIQQEKAKMEYELELARLKQPRVSAHAEANPTQTTTSTINVTISLEQAIKQLDEISADNLSTTDKDTLKEYLYSLEGSKAAKDKEKFWSKAKEILRFIADKGADAAIAVLPLIIAGL